MGKAVIIVIALILLVGGFFIFSINSISSFENVESFEGDMLMYKSSTCGCCGVYSEYFKRQGSSNLKIINSPDMNAVMEEHNIPSSMESCHTLIIGDYFVEGHVPLEAIEKMLEEMPDIDGIAMPGMPTGSPGMPGQKNGQFVIYQVKDGHYSEYMRI